MTPNIMAQIKNDLDDLKDEVFAILLYGSYAEGKANLRSDVDICIVIGANDKEQIKKIYHATLLVSGKHQEYDIKIFELLPLKIKFEVIEKGKILYAKDIPRMYEYFYFYRKVWEDQSVNWIGK